MSRQVCVSLGRLHMSFSMMNAVVSGGE